MLLLVNITPQETPNLVARDIDIEVIKKKGRMENKSLAEVRGINLLVIESQSCDPSYSLSSKMFPLAW